MNYKSLLQVLLFSGILFISQLRSVSAHCEIPCGIYGDSLRIDLIEEHISTIEKSMNTIIDLSEEAEKNHNQLVRWITNKEEHASKIQKIVSQYFMHQRISPQEPTEKTVYDKYVKQLTLLHKLQVYAMKAKQTTDTAYISKLRNTLSEFEKSYFHTHTH